MTDTLSIAVIVNPAAGRGAAGRALPELRRRLAERFPRGNIAYFATRSRGEGESLAARAIERGATLLTAAGGDGTLHEVVNGVLAAEERGNRVVVGLIPLGTGNDFARGVGLGGSVRGAVETLACGEARHVDIGEIEGAGLPGVRRFLVAAGVGFVAETARVVNDGVRGLHGPAAYICGAVKTLSGFSPPLLTLSFDGAEPETMRAMLVSVSNVATTGGGIRIAPNARPDDGWLDVCLVSAMSKARLLRKLPAAFAGNHVRDKAVRMLRVHEIAISASPPCALWIDGEVLGSTPARFTIKRSALAMMLPTGYPAPTKA